MVLRMKNLQKKQSNLEEVDFLHSVHLIPQNHIMQEIVPQSTPILQLDI